MPTLKIPEGPYEIESVMRELGEYFRAEASSLSRAAPAVSAAPSPDAPGEQPNSNLKNLLESAERSAKVGFPVRYNSHRRWLGGVVNRIKGLIFWGVRLPFETLVERQEAFNRSVMELQRAHLEELIRNRLWIARLADSMGKLERQSAQRDEAIRAIQSKLDELGGKSAQSEDQLGALTATLAELATGLEQLERTSRADREEIGAMQAGLKKAHEDAYELTLKFDYTASEAMRRAEDSETRQQEFNQKIAAATGELRSRHDLSGLHEPGKREQYLALMDGFRGTSEDISKRLEIYVDYFRNRPGQILDVGCGRGEFLHLLRYAGIESWGCDTDPLMIRHCGTETIFVREMDAISALNSVPAGSLGGIFSAQVIEHMFPGDLVAFLKLSRERIAPGGVIVLETVNPQTLGVLSKSYYRDLDHKKAIDPDYLARVLELTGFEKVEVHRIHCFSPEERLPALPPPETFGVSLKAHHALQMIVDRLNDAIWGAQDYYVMGETPRS